MDTTQEELKQHDQVKSIGFIVVIVIVGAFIAFMSWVWGSSEPLVPTGGAGPGGITPAAVAGAGGGGGGRESGQRRRRERRPTQGEREQVRASSGTEVAVSHPQLLQPVAGWTIQKGEATFSGVAETGTKVVLYADGVEIGNGIASADGKFSFGVMLSESEQKKYSLKYFSEAGKLIQSVEDLGLKTPGQDAQAGN